MSDRPLLEVRDLTVRFDSRHRSRAITAVEGVSFSIAAGRTLGLVGESGCGKTSLARAILRLTPAAAGDVRLDGRDVLRADCGQLRDIRRRMQVVFQDPYTSLNPRRRIGDTIAEGLVVHGIGSVAEQREAALAMLIRVGLTPDHSHRYPHELSGGQRQRVAIARALILRPMLVILDEPVSALDVSVQAQILNLLADLQSEYKVSYLFIGHNIGTVRQVSDDIAVMYSGRIVESGPADELLSRPRHPYTQALLAAVLEPGPLAELGPNSLNASLAGA